MKPLLLVLWFFCLCIASGVAQGDDPVNSEQSEWGRWDATILNLKIYSLPLTEQQIRQIEDKIEKMKGLYGTGILGEVESQISEMDSSNLNEPDNNNNKGISSRKFYDDLSIEQEIILLEMESQKPKAADEKSAEGQQIFEKIMNSLDKIEKEILEKTNNTNSEYK